LKSHPDNQAAYVLLYHSADSSTIPGIIDYFNSLPKQALKDQQLLLACLYLRQNKIDKAKEVNDMIIKENPNTSLSVRAMLNNFNIALYNENDINNAAAILSYVKNQSALSTPVEIKIAQDALYTYNLTMTSNSNFYMQKPSIYEEEYKPKDYTLLQNFPNPFNPTTIIHYEIPYDGLVTLKIYDELGREVKTLVNQYQSKGKYDINFNGGNLASGVYFYQLHAGSFVATKKLLLLK